MAGNSKTTAEWMCAADHRVRASAYITSRIEWMISSLPTPRMAASSYLDGEPMKIRNLRRRRAGGWRRAPDSRNDCHGCPIRAQCTTAKVSARIVTITEHTAELQRLRAFQRTEQFKKRYRRRVVVEHRIGRPVQLGIRQARYLGRVKVAYQVTLAAAVANLVLATSKGSDRFARVLHSLDTAVRLVTRCRIADLARIVDQPLDSRSIPLALLSRRGRPQLAPSRPVF